MADVPKARTTETAGSGEGLPSGFDWGAVARFLARNGILVAFAVFMLLFTLAEPRFIGLDNVMGVIRSSAILGVMALGVTFVVISGNLDLSVGSMMSFSTIAVLHLQDAIGPVLGIPVMFAMTLSLGAFIGFLVGYLRLNSLIVTLGMLSAIHGLTLTYSGGQNMDIADKAGTWFGVLGRGDVMGIPLPILIFALLAAILGIVLARTPFGRKVYAHCRRSENCRGGPSSPRLPKPASSTPTGNGSTSARRAGNRPSAICRAATSRRS